MTARDRSRVVFHGAVLILVGFLLGLPSVVEEMGATAREWRAAHGALLLAGVWLLAVASAFPALALPRREAAALVLSLIATGYGFLIAILIQTVTGERAFGFTASPALLVAFVANLVTVLGAIVSTGLVLIGARAALKSRTGALRE